MRDLDGRTYAAATVALPSLQISALDVCIAMAVASGAKGAEAVVVLGENGLQDADLAALREFAGAGVPAYSGGPSGKIASALAT